MAVTVKSSGPRGAKTYEIRWKRGELYDVADNAFMARTIAAKARKEEKEYYSPSRRNPFRKVKGRKVKNGRAVTLKNFTGTITRLAGGVIHVHGKKKR